jgi:adenosine deaminase
MRRGGRRWSSLQLWARQPLRSHVSAPLFGALSSRLTLGCGPAKYIRSKQFSTAKIPPVPPQKPLSLEVLRRLPKADLHLHLDGSVRLSTVIDLAKEQGVSLPSFDLKELSKSVLVNPDCPSLVEYLRGFEITLSVLQKPYAITRVMYEICEDAVADGVRYLEVRFSPILHTREGMNLSQVMEAICEGQAMVEHNLPIFARVIVCGMRQMSPQDSEKLAEITWRYREKGVIAFDLAGPEHGFRSKHHKSAFDIIHKNHLNCTLHAGEAAGPESIQDSIRWCGAHRIGHGVTLKQSPTLMQYVIDRRIPIECCITSNLHTKAIQSPEEHPIREYLEAGGIVVPCTDNTTMSAITLSSEYALYQKAHNFNLQEMVKLIDNGFSAAFLQATHKRRLRAEALRDCLRILNEEGYDTGSITKADDSLHWQGLGVDFTTFRHLAAVTKEESKHGYWGGHTNPEITLDVVRQIPKADLHCRLDGSVKAPLLWEELQRAHGDLESTFGIQCKSAKDMEKLLKTSQNHDLVTRMFNAALQTPDQLRRAVKDIYRTAHADNVSYMELVVRPNAHTSGRLSKEEVVDIILEAQQEADQELKQEGADGIISGLVLYAHPGKDDPLEFFQTARLAVKYSGKGVIGFAVHGDRELQDHEYEFFQSSFDYLKRANMNVTISAGRTSPNSIVSALHAGGACRIGEAFQIHLEPSLMNYFATHSVPIELGLSSRYQQQTSALQVFAGSPIRLLMDNGVPVVLCSFKDSLAQGRNEMLHEVIKQARFSVSEMLRLVLNAFDHGFQTHPVRDKLVKKAWVQSKKVLSERGFRYFFRKQWFPQDDEGDA